MVIPVAGWASDRFGAKQVWMQVLTISRAPVRHQVLFVTRDQLLSSEVKAA